MHTHAHTSLQPEWEESLLLNEQVEHFSSQEHLLIFFELLDFSSSHLTPWHKIAWAFLSPQGHIGQRCRLQLFQFPKKSHCPPDMIEVGKKEREEREGGEEGKGREERKEREGRKEGRRGREKREGEEGEEREEREGRFSVCDDSSLSGRCTHCGLTGSSSLIPAPCM